MCSVLQSIMSSGLRMRCVLRGMLPSGLLLCSVLQGMLSSGLRMCCVLQGIMSSGWLICSAVQGMLFSGLRMCCVLQGLLSSGNHLGVFHPQRQPPTDPKTGFWRLYIFLGVLITKIYQMAIFVK